MMPLGDHAWMGGLFADDEMAELFAPAAELQRYLQIEAAWTRALGSVEGQPSANIVAKKIAAAPITPDALKDGFSRDGVPVPALVATLKSQLSTDEAHWVHRGLTSQDVMDTSLVLALGDVMALVLARLIALDQQLDGLQSQYAASQVMAYTRMQAALDTRADSLIGRWRQPLTRLIDGVRQLTPQIDCIQWGGPIGERAHQHASALGHAFANQLGLGDPGHAWHTDRRIISDTAHLLSGVTVATGKMGEDIAMMASLGPDHITLTGGGSSAMPHKNNPIKAETLVALADYAATLQSGLARSARHEAHRSGRAWTLEWLTLPQLCAVTGTSLLLSQAVLDSINRVGQSR